jgi:hypothetical protein
MSHVKVVAIIILVLGMVGCASQGENKRLAALEAQVEQQKLKSVN